MGCVVALGAPPFDLYPALWVGMAGLCWVLALPPKWPPFASRSRLALTGARRGLAFGAVANLVALRFVPGVVVRFTPLPYVAGLLALALLAAFEATRWGLAAVACETLVRARVPRPLAFAAGVYAGTFVPTMIPWTVAGGLSPWPQFVQLADVVGERGVAALLALEAGLLAEALIELRTSRGEAARRAAAFVALVVAQGWFGAWRMTGVEAQREKAPHVRVGLVQPSVDASTRWEEDRAPLILARLADLSRAAESRGAELVVWPEGAYPYRLPHGARRDDPASAIVRPGMRGPVMMGLLTTGAPGGAAYNSALVATREGALSGTYDKRHLLWFGETVPLADRVPLLRQVFARGLGLAPGAASPVLLTGKVRAGMLICYEDTLPEAGREAMSGRPNLLVNLTNDAWFAGSAEGELHLRLAVLRAVELRRDLVRAVDEGPPSWIDAAGRVRARGSATFASSLVATPALLETEPSVYARLGDAPWALALLVLANVAVWRAGR